MRESFPQMSAEELAKVINFLGYGSLSDSVWFIGIEEGLGEMGTGDANMNLKARGSFEETMDLYEAHRRLQRNENPIDIETKPPSTQVWRWIAKIMRARKGNSDWGDRNHAKEYVQYSLGRRGGGTFLTELSPIPARRSKDKKKLGPRTGLAHRLAK